MLWTAFVFVAGLVAGWTVLPQPQWVRRLYANAAVWLSNKLDDL